MMDFPSCMLNIRSKGDIFVLVMSLSSYAPVPPSKHNDKKSKAKPATEESAFLAFAPEPPPMNIATPRTIKATFTYFLRGYR